MGVLVVLVFMWRFICCQFRDASYEVTACYGDSLSLSCSPSRRIRVVMDSLGRSTACGSYTGGVCEVATPSSISLVHQLCNGRSQCAHVMAARGPCADGYSNSQTIRYTCISDAVILDICTPVQYYTTTEVHLTSPLYPASYPPNLTCSCVITPSSGLVNVDVIQMAIRYSEPCSDWLLIGARIMCGSYVPSIPPRLYQLSLAFHSDNYESQSGFWITATASQGSLEVHCVNLTLRQLLYTRRTEGSNRQTDTGSMDDNYGQQTATTTDYVSQPSPAETTTQIYEAAAIVQEHVAHPVHLERQMALLHTGLTSATNGPIGDIPSYHLGNPSDIVDHTARVQPLLTNTYGARDNTNGKRDGTNRARETANGTLGTAIPAATTLNSITRSTTELDNYQQSSSTPVQAGDSEYVLIVDSDVLEAGTWEDGESANPPSSSYVGEGMQKIIGNGARGDTSENSAEDRLSSGLSDDRETIRYVDKITREEHLRMGGNRNVSWLNEEFDDTVRYPYEITTVVRGATRTHVAVSPDSAPNLSPHFLGTTYANNSLIIINNQIIPKGSADVSDKLLHYTIDKKDNNSEKGIANPEKDNNDLPRDSGYLPKAGTPQTYNSWNPIYKLWPTTAHPTYPPTNMDNSRDINSERQNIRSYGEAVSGNAENPNLYFQSANDNLTASQTRVSSASPTVNWNVPSSTVNWNVQSSTVNWNVPSSTVNWNVPSSMLHLSENRSLLINKNTKTHDITDTPLNNSISPTSDALASTTSHYNDVREQHVSIKSVDPGPSVGKGLELPSTRIQPVTKTNNSKNIVQNKGLLEEQGNGSRTALGREFYLGLITPNDVVTSNQVRNESLNITGRLSNTHQTQRTEESFKSKPWATWKTISVTGAVAIVCVLCVSTAAIVYKIRVNKPHRPRLALIHARNEARENQSRGYGHQLYRDVELDVNSSSMISLKRTNVRQPGVHYNFQFAVSRKSVHFKNDSTRGNVPASQFTSTDVTSTARIV